MQKTHSMPDGARALFLSPRGRAPHDVVSLLERQGLSVMERLADAGAYGFASHIRPDLILIEDGRPCQRSWQELASDVRRAHPGAWVILLTENGSEELAVAALRHGLQDYLTLPLSAPVLRQALERCVFPGSREKMGECQMDLSPDPIMGSSATLCRAKSYMTRAAATDSTVLITGETGTGKELTAEFIHTHSRRRERPFVCINCAAIPDQLLESELFGHTKGAFTGAQDHHAGLLAAAEGGTVFLDEVGDMSLSAQAKILRVIEKKEVCRLGGTQLRQIDVRFVAATNQDLETMTNSGSFRKDLFYRLNVARVELPPLRERKEDIPLLVEHYRHKLGGGSFPRISEECLRCLLRYNWPGNVRELKNVLESILLADAHGEIGPEHLPPRLRELMEKSCDEMAPEERERLLAALCSAQWNKSRAAEALRWSRMTLYRKMAKYRISRLNSAAAV